MTEPMGQRVIRVPDAVWEAARRRAENRGETVSEAVRRFLKEYGRMEISDFFRAVEQDIAEQSAEHVEMVITATLDGRAYVWAAPTNEAENRNIKPFIDLAMEM